MTEDILIKLLQKQDETAFRELVEGFQDKVFHTCLGFVRNSEDAEDLAQEVFVEVYHSVKKFRGEAKLSTWIYRIATSKSLEFLRKKKAKKRVAIFQSLLGFEKASEEMEIPSFVLENKEEAQILLTAIDKLAKNQKIAFTLHKIEGLSYQEIAEIMELSVSSVESLMFRAKKNLKKRLYHYYKNKNL